MIVITCRAWSLQAASLVSWVCGEEVLCCTILLGTGPVTTIITIDFTTNIAVAARLWEEVEGE